MRILHVVSSINPKAGGVTQALSTMIHQFAQHNLINEVVTSDVQNDVFLKNINFKVYPLGPSKTAWGYSPRLKIWLKQHLNDYDHVILHGLWQYQSLALYKSLKLRQKGQTKVFVMPHGMLDPYFQKDKGRRLKAIRNWVIWYLIEQKIINKSNGILFTCEIEKLLAEQTFNRYNPQRQEVIGLGVDKPALYNDKMRVDFQNKVGTRLETYWLFFSRIDTKKGIDILLNAYLNLKRKGYLVPPLVIAGPGIDTDFGQQMLSIVKDENFIFFTGMLEGDAKLGALYGAELFILPSHQENFGIAIVEAMACGTPVLITDKVNIYKEIKDGGGGIVVNDNLESLVKGLIAWLDKSIIEKVKMGSNAHYTFTTSFRTEQIATKFLKVINAN